MSFKLSRFPRRRERVLKNADKCSGISNCLRNYFYRITSTLMADHEYEIIIKQHRHITCNVILKCFLTNIVKLCVCCLTHPEFYVHVPYFHLWRVGCKIFSHIISEKHVIDHEIYVMTLSKT